MSTNTLSPASELTKLAIDFGYSGYAKCVYQDQYFKFQLSIDFFNNYAIAYGQNNHYEFENEKLIVGTSNQTEDSFSTTDYKFLHKYGPIAIFYILEKLKLLDQLDKIELKIGIALIDWNKRLEFLDRMRKINISCYGSNFPNGVKMYDLKLNNITLYTQGQGSGKYFTIVDREGVYPNTLLVIDIGYNTINLIYFEKGKPIANRSKPLPGHGISTVIKPFQNFLESITGMNFSEAEAIGYFIQGNMIFHGLEKPEVTAEIIRLKGVFIKKLMNNLMVSEKKGLATSEVVLFTGGGAYYIKDAQFPPNFKFNSKGIHEFENVLGYFYDTTYDNTTRIINGEVYEY